MARRRSAIKLRPLRPGDVDPLSSWLPAAAAALGCERFASGAALRRSADVPGLFAVDEGGPAGLLHFETAAPGAKAARIRLLLVAPERRRLGIGGRAALALETRLSGEVERIYVAVPSHLGLALYFWLRLGYRPLTQAEWPAAPERAPATWMVRELK